MQVTAADLVEVVQSSHFVSFSSASISSNLSRSPMHLYVSPQFAAISSTFRRVIHSRMAKECSSTTMSQVWCCRWLSLGHLLESCWILSYLLSSLPSFSLCCSCLYRGPLSQNYVRSSAKKRRPWDLSLSVTCAAKGRKREVVLSSSLKKVPLICTVKLSLQPLQKRNHQRLKRTSRLKKMPRRKRKRSRRQM